jgi:hypothetical protein
MAIHNQYHFNPAYPATTSKLAPQTPNTRHQTPNTTNTSTIKTLTITHTADKSHRPHGPVLRFTMAGTFSYILLLCKFILRIQLCTGFIVIGINVSSPFKTTNPDVKAPLDIVHLDLSGPIAPTSMQGNRYVTKFTDYYSRKITTYFSKGKTAEEVLTNLKTFIADTSHIGRVKIFRADQGPEYSQCCI